MDILARAPTPAEFFIIAIVSLIPLAALVIAFLILVRITGPPKPPSDPAPKPQEDPRTDQDLQDGKTHSP